MLKENETTNFKVLKKRRDPSGTPHPLPAGERVRVRGNFRYV